MDLLKTKDNDNADKNDGNTLLWHIVRDLFTGQVPYTMN